MLLGRESVVNFKLISSRPFTIQGREPYLCNCAKVKKNNNKTNKKKNKKKNNNPD